MTYRGRAPGYRKDSAELLATIIHTLLEHGTGLLVGPDCDGALNTCDTHTLPPAAAGRAGAGDQDRGAFPRARLSVRHGDTRVWTEARTASTVSVHDMSTLPLEQ